MSELAEFLIARYDERERIALATAPSGLRLAWRVSHEVNDEGTLVHWVVSDPRHPSAVAEAFGLERGTGGAVAEHIALNDPARVLREVEAGRKILAEHSPEPWGEPHPEWLRCSQGHGDEYWTQWPCIEVRSIVAVYSDHSDYKPEWKL